MADRQHNRTSRAQVAVTPMPAVYVVIFAVTVTAFWEVLGIIGVAIGVVACLCLHVLLDGMYYVAARHTRANVYYDGIWGEVKDE